jgi:DNA-directed RNA polymerase specialized sigma24 family protein
MEEEKEFIRQNYRILPTREIAAKLGRSFDAVINLAGPLGISAGRSRPWSEEEQEYLRSHYRRFPVENIAAELGRTVKAVATAAAKLKLTRRRAGVKRKARSRRPSTQVNLR